MVARFTKDKYGWRCTKVWKGIRLDKHEGEVRSYPGIAIHMNVSKQPKIGFCRKPHTYI
jgi:hypothetical protein